MQSLRALAKLVLFRKVGHADRARQALADYSRATADAMAKIRAEAVPHGLGAFQRDVLSASIYHHLCALDLF